MVLVTFRQTIRDTIYEDLLVAAVGTAELGYNVMKGTECFVSLETSVVLTEGYNIMINSQVSRNI